MKTTAISHRIARLQVMGYIFCLLRLGPRYDWIHNLRFSKK